MRMKGPLRHVSGPSALVALALLSAMAVGVLLWLELPRGHAAPYQTLYASYDNTPPNSTRIEFSRCMGFATVHCQAGGTGTYADPITMATDPRELAVGARVYSTHLRKYAVMEDSCAECTADWNTHHRSRFDFYAATTTNPEVTTCEDALTTKDHAVVTNPPPNEPVDPTPIFNSQTGACWRP